MITRIGTAVLMSSLLLSAVALADHDARPNVIAEKPAGEKPPILEGVGIEEKLGQKLDLSLPFKDENGTDVTLGSYFDGKNPVIVSPVYFSCPGLCNFHLNGLTEALKDVPWSVGTKFKVLAISFDSKETPAIASAKKDNYMKVYGRPGTEGGWHFLTGTEDSVRALTSSVGFKYRWNEEAKEWAHASAAIVASPSGMISRYLPGIQFEPNDVKLAINEAGEGKVGTLVDQLILYCFHYNPQQSRYTMYAGNVMKLGGLVVMLVLGLWLLPFWIRHRRRNGEARSS